MTSAPSQITKATGMLPETGGVSGFVVVSDFSCSVSVSISPELAKSWSGIDNGIAVAMLNVAVILSKSRLFISPSFPMNLIWGGLQKPRELIP
jgi:hypothetical protein